MTKFYANEIVKSPKPVIFFLLAFLSFDCFGSFLSLRSSGESQENLLKLPIQNQLNGLENSEPMKLILGSRPPSTPEKSPSAEFSKSLKFDLNELPEENDSYLGNGIFKKENEKELHQAFKKQRMEIARVPINQELIGISSRDYNSFNDFGQNQLPSTLIFKSLEHSLISKNQPSSSESTLIRNFGQSDSKSSSSQNINQPKTHIEQTALYANSNLGKNPDINAEKQYYGFTDWESKINSRQQKDTNGLDEKGYYGSPYNRALLKFLKENLYEIMPKELENYRFTSEFLYGIENCFWSNELGIFVLVEETVRKVMFAGDSWSHKRKGYKWLGYSAKGLETPKLHEASVGFRFSSVFLKLYTYEKLNRTFFTEKMRLSALKFLTGLEKKLGVIQSETKKRRSSYRSIIDRIFRSLPGYLVLSAGTGSLFFHRTALRCCTVLQEFTQEEVNRSDESQFCRYELRRAEETPTVRDC
ncbi:hypothetical protein BY996DRAFT_6417190 [Phakopsora pachyrhizi]|nr:hypothetical protein BY996DRAFT_6417190 [Phakopsora pachyrhizi]